MTRICDEGLQNLAAALLKLSCQDWMRAKVALEKDPSNILAKKDIVEIETFLKSEWCYALTDMDGGYILKRLEAAYASGEVIKRNKVY